MKRAITTLLAAAALSASAYNVQIGVTGLYTADRVYTNKTFVYTIVPTNTHLAVGNVGGVEIYERSNDCAGISLNGGSISLYTQNGYYGTVTIPLAETTYVGTFGYYYSAIPGQDWRWFNAVCTVRGNPYSLVANRTGQDRYVNGLLIKSGESGNLPFPHTLTMDEVPGIRFFDIYSEDELFPADNGYGQTYWKGAYHLAWSGDFFFTDDTSLTNRAASAERLVYSDADTNKLLYAQNDKPIYQGTVSISTNVSLMTWWDFNQNEWGDPQAKINGEVVCPSHDTSHLISYRVNVGDVRVSDMSGVGSFTFTMSQTPQSGHSGGSCTFKCWDAQVSAYADAPAEHRAEISGSTSTVAKFRVNINIMTGVWKVEPAN